MKHILLITGLALGFYEAWVGFWLYKWFLLPITGYEIKYLHFYGIALLIGFVTHQNHPSDDNPVIISMAEACAGTLIKSTVALIIGFFISAYV
jgi:hypothetical protein